jgi:hypothetical protein
MNLHCYSWNHNCSFVLLVFSTFINSWVYIHNCIELWKPLTLIGWIFSFQRKKKSKLWGKNVVSLLEWKALILCEKREMWEYILRYSLIFYIFQRMFENNGSTISTVKFSFQIRAMGQQIELLTKMTKKLKDEMDSMKQ